MGTPHLVVDGSNIATEGRSMPSLQQLLDAVDAVTKELKPSNVTVIVDATFGHRIDKAERDEYETATSKGQIITPPAGVIGRGDAFILEVADRADAVILSNDSFQEFHGKYEWLFEEGRLLGGKHVPGVGWIFLARSPVRGPTSRRAVSDAKRKRRGTKKAAAATGPKSTRASKATKSSTSTKRTSSSSGSAKGSGSQADRRKTGGKEPEPYNEPLPFIEFVGAHPVGSIVEAEVEQFSSHGAYVLVDGTRCYVALKSLANPAPRSARDILTLGETHEFVVKAIDTPRRGIDLAIPGVVEDDDTDDEPTTAEAPAEAPPESKSTRGRSRSRGGARGNRERRRRDRDGDPSVTDVRRCDTGRRRPEAQRVATAEASCSAGSRRGSHQRIDRDGEGDDGSEEEGSGEKGRRQEEGPGEAQDGGQEGAGEAQDGGQEGPREAQDSGEEGPREAQDGGQEGPREAQDGGQEGPRQAQDGGQEGAGPQAGHSREEAVLVRRGAAGGPGRPLLFARASLSSEKRWKSIDTKSPSDSAHNRSPTCRVPVVKILRPSTRSKTPVIRSSSCRGVGER